MFYFGYGVFWAKSGTNFGQFFLGKIITEVMAFFEIKDLTMISLVSKKLRLIACPILWRDPDLTKSIKNKTDLKELAELKLPIKTMRLSQMQLILCYNNTNVICTFVEKLKKLKLKFFYLNKVQMSCHINSTTLSLFLKELPVSEVNTSCFLCTNMSKEKFVDALCETNKRPDIQIERQFHDLLSIEDWQRLSILNITSIRTQFTKIISHEYIDILGGINSKPGYWLNGDLEEHNGVFSPEDLQAFAKNVKLSHLPVHLLDLSYGVSKYIKVLEETQQSPLFSFYFRQNSTTMSQDDFQLLFFKFHVDQFHTGFYQILWSMRKQSMSSLKW